MVVKRASAILQSPAPDRVIEVHNVLGEGILWDAERRALWWTDIQGSCLHRYDWDGDTLKVIGTPERVGSFALVEGSKQLLVAFASQLAFFDPDTGNTVALAHSDIVGTGLRFNDGRVDRQGRFWVGTMIEDGRETSDGYLHCVEAGGRVRTRLGGIRISNSLCTSPDGTQLYFADSPTRTIRAFDMQEPGGILMRERIFARTPEGEFPDGAAVDADACLWSAHWGGGCIVRYRPDGTIERRLRVPASQPTCVCFAGPELDVLCVTSARQDLNDETLRREPGAGNVFLYRLDVKGLSEERYRP